MLPGDDGVEAVTKGVGVGAGTRDAEAVDAEGGNVGKGDPVLLRRGDGVDVSGGEVGGCLVKKSAAVGLLALCLVLFFILQEVAPAPSSSGESAGAEEYTRPGIPPSLQ